MKEFLKALFSTSSEVSSMRILAVFMVLAATVYLFKYGTSDPSSNFITLIALLYSIALTGKVTQKFFEK